MVDRYRQRKIKHPENKNALWYELLLQDSSKNKESKLTKKCRVPHNLSVIKLNITMTILWDVILCRFMT